MDTLKTPLFAAVVVLCGAVAASAQRDFSDVEIKIVPVAGHIYMLEGAGGNIGVSIGDDGVLIVDDQFAPLAARIEAAIASLGPGELRFVLNTHHHHDHTGGNEIFGGQGAVIVAHDHVRSRLVANEDVGPAGYPVITYAHGASVHFNGEEIKLEYAGPAHTDGDTIVHFTGSNVIHMGDLFFNGRFPYVDLGSGGSVDGYLSAVKRVLDSAAADTQIIPGHGPLATVEDLRIYHEMMSETIGFVREAMAAGRSLEAIKSLGLPERWNGWGSGFISEERWIETIHRSTGG